MNDADSIVRMRTLTRFVFSTWPTVAQPSHRGCDSACPEQCSRAIGDTPLLWLEESMTLEGAALEAYIQSHHDALTP
jgi:hypothetical protein